MPSARAQACSLALLFTLAGCATNPAPRGFLRDTDSAQREAYGGWVEVSYTHTGTAARARGELIAVSADSLWIMNGAQGTVVATAEVVDGKLVGYDGKYGEMAGGTVLGTIATISNGAFLIITAPMWIIGGSIASGAQSRIATTALPALHWNELAAWARFPQGMPNGWTWVELGDLSR